MFLVAHGLRLRPGSHGVAPYATARRNVLRLAAIVAVSAVYFFYGARQQTRPSTSMLARRSRLQLNARAVLLPSNTHWSMDDACASVPTATTGSCTQLTTSGFPYLGHDVFMDACHHTYVPGQRLQLLSPSLIFLHPRDIERFGNEVVDTLEHDVVLVSNSNVDECLPYRSSDDEPRLRTAYTRILESTRVRAWYGPNVVERHAKLKPLPLGGKWNWRIAEHHAEDENKGPIVKVLSALASDPQANFRRADRPNLLFTRMNPSTSDGATYAPTRGHRRDALEAAREIKQAATAQPSSPRDKPICANGAAFAHVDRLQEYLQDMRTYKFVLSPPGNGLDTHRTWEALLMGAIPIVESSAMDPLFQGLPVLILNSWQELSTELLEKTYAEFQRREAYCWGKLFAPYYVMTMMRDLLQP